MAKFGWNTKGTLGVPKLKSFSDFLKDNDIKDIWLRIQGGTISQKEYNVDWKDSDIQAWGDLYKANPTVNLVFVINMNELPENIKLLFNRFLAVGCKFAFIEFGNEQYQHKYRLSKDKPEVTPRTKAMTPEKYLNLCDQYLAQFIGYDLAFQLAPNKGTNIDQFYNNWNDVVLNYTKNMPTVNYTMHVYANAGFRWELISEIQEKIKNKFLAITEFGAADAADGEQNDLSEEEVFKMIQDVANILSEELRIQDIAFDQVLWVPWETTAIAFKDGQLTPKGQLVLDAFTPEVVDVEEPVEPTIIVLTSYWSTYQRTFWGRLKVYQELSFSDDSVIHNVVKFNRRKGNGKVITNKHLGKTFEEIEKLIS